MFKTRVRNGIAAVVAVLVLQPWACERWEKKLDARRIELSAAATACPAPATCSEKHRGDGGHDFKVCSPVSGEASYAAGDVVLVHEIALDMIARVKGPKGPGYAVEFADGNTLERSKSTIVKRVCN